MRDHFYIKIRKNNANYHMKIVKADVLFIKACADYVELYTTTDRYITHLTISNMVEMYPDLLYRVSRSCAINIDKIDFYCQGDVSVGGHLIAIGESGEYKNRRDEVLKVMYGEDKKETYKEMSEQYKKVIVKDGEFIGALQKELADLKSKYKSQEWEPIKNLKPTYEEDQLILFVEFKSSSVIEEYLGTLTQAVNFRRYQLNNAYTHFKLLSTPAN